jgi:NADH:ubiquinone oxidoreductase subunit 5 (subunit L)/multisubunit Na+/H+ antiporter MnhA subunit
MRPFALMICTLSVFYGSFMAIGQEDLKRIIAYSSIAHMNFALLGIFSKTVYGYLGGLCMMVSHGIVSPALFLAVGVLYERFGDRNVLRYGGLSSLLPSFITCFYIFILSNFSFPLTSNFVGEFLIFISLGVSVHQFVLIVVAGSSYFAMVYSMLLYSKMAYGGLKVPGAEEDARKNIKTVFEDMTRKEAYVFYVLMFGNFVFGIIPTVFLTYFYLAVCDWFNAVPEAVLTKQMSAEDVYLGFAVTKPAKVFTKEMLSKKVTLEVEGVNEGPSQGPVITIDITELMMSVSRQGFGDETDALKKAAYLEHQMAEVLYRKYANIPADTLSVCHYQGTKEEELMIVAASELIEDLLSAGHFTQSELTLQCEK